jgi:co-chaperonin GroES (HSP10)
MAHQELLIIGDRVLIEPDGDKERTESGLYLPQGIAEKENIQSGRVARTGPGYIVPSVADSAEPWLNHRSETRYIPLQVQEGDYAIFLRKEAVEVEYDGKKYLIIPQAGILAVEREHASVPPDDQVG